VDKAIDIDAVIERYVNGGVYPEDDEELRRVVDMLLDIGILKFGVDPEKKEVRVKVNRASYYQDYKPSLFDKFSALSLVLGLKLFHPFKSFKASQK